MVFVKIFSQRTHRNQSIFLKKSRKKKKKKKHRIYNPGLTECCSLGNSHYIYLKSISIVQMIEYRLNG